MKKIILTLSCVTVLLISCNSNQKKQTSEKTADAIYYNGDIITMEGDSAHYAEAVAIKAGKILFASSRNEAENMKGDSTNMIDLQGKTLLPGFIDAHGHVWAAGF